ncbi:MULTISPECIES: glutaredoxin domain-containing protein [Mycobacteroides]|uniref:glutaredoxin domain-containing protein n=1 Tax=Mycobacteroides TaxID=670516 RepID=UPI0009BEBCEF|nr:MULTISPECIES: glutaredoxin domain-containing protein [Mycobacteroides]
MTSSSAQADGITVYWRPGCPYSIKLRTQLRLTRIKYTEINIWECPDAAAYVRSVADGNETVPTVDVAGHPLVNPSLRQLLSAARAHAPAALRRR